MTIKLIPLAFGVFAFVALPPIGPVRADAVDGHWCHTTDGRMSISGPNIVTPGGAQMLGLYGRHSFSYVVPAAETGSGTTLNMILIDDDTVHLTNGANTTAAAPQIWHRCPADVS